MGKMSEVESEYLKGRLTRALKGKSFEGFIQTLREFEEEFQDQVEWNIRYYALEANIDRGAGFILAAYMGEMGLSRVSVLVNVAESSTRPPRFIINLFQRYSDMILSFESLPHSKRKVVGAFVEKYFDPKEKSDFFKQHAECIPIKEEVKSENSIPQQGEFCLE